MNCAEEWRSELRHYKGKSKWGQDSLRMRL